MLQSTGKTVSSGKVKEVSKQQLLGAAALSYKDRQKQAHVREMPVSASLSLLMDQAESTV